MKEKGEMAEAEPRHHSCRRPEQLVWKRRGQRNKRRKMLNNQIKSPKCNLQLTFGRPLLLLVPF